MMMSSAHGWRNEVSLFVEAHFYCQSKHFMNEQKNDPYQLVTDTIIAHLEKGVVPWRCPWNRTVGIPANFSTGNAYQGVNIMLLGLQSQSSPWWMTYKQAKEWGGSVRKGEKGSLIFKYGSTDSTKPDEPEEEKQSKRKQGRRMFLRSYTVFNATQIEGIPFPSPLPAVTLSETQRIKRADNIIKAMPLPPVIRENPNGHRAYYTPALDSIDMPAFGRFNTAEDFYRTLLHELVHATGHAKRLARKGVIQSDGFGGKNYSQEELVAEIGSAFLCHHAGIDLDRHEKSAAYLQAWLTVLKVRENRTWIVQAAGQASRAADYILGKKDNHELSQLK
jgi:antirestriction protein ArdC